MFSPSDPNGVPAYKKGSVGGGGPPTKNDREDTNPYDINMMSTPKEESK